MRKRIETQVVHRGRYYFVIIRQYRKILFWRIWEDVWRELPERFLSRTEAGKLAVNIDKYFRGQYVPKSAR